MGASVYSSEVLPAILRYGTFDRYYLPEIPKSHIDEVYAVPEIRDNLQRISFLPEHLVPTLCEPDALVLFSPGPNLRRLACLRNRIRRFDAPITSVLHSINYHSSFEETFLELLAPLANFDALLVASSAGARAVDRRIKFVIRRCRQLHHLELQFLPQLLNIPLGVNAELYGGETPRPQTDLRASYLLPNDAVVILYIGRFSAVSKADLLPLLIAFSNLPYRKQQIYLLLAGDDTQFHLSTDVLAFSQMLGCFDHVRVITDPQQKEKINLYRLADIFVSPSDSIQETFGITLIEAMAASLPVVASDWSGYRDIVVDGSTGFLIPTIVPHYPSEFDALQSSGIMIADDLLARTTVVNIPRLEDALLSLSVDKDLRQKFGAEGRRRVELVYDWKRVIYKYEESWAQLIQDAHNAVTADGISSCPLDIYPYEDIFGHFATRRLDTDDSIMIRPLSKELRSRPDQLARIVQPADRFHIEIFENILRVLEGRQMSSVDALVKEIPINAIPSGLRSLSNKTIILVHVARLLKYGLISLAEQRPRQI